jgi:tetratricopeptide (TPR) repeat protein
MKKIAKVLLSIFLLTSISNAAELSAQAPASNATVEIDKVFVDSQLMKKKSKFRKEKQEISVKKDIKQDTDKSKLELKKESNKKTKEQNQSSLKEIELQTPEVKKEIIKTNSSKELKEQLRQEDEKRKYRELEELTEINQKAVALYTDNNLDDSLKTFAKIPEEKRTPEIWLLMGNILMDKGKVDDATFMYGRAILTDSTYYKAYYNLGNIYLSQDKFNMAVDQYKQALKYNQNNAYVYYNLGCAYLKLGELKKAKYSFIRAVEIKKNIPDFHYNLAYVFKRLGKEKQAKIYLENYNKLTGEVN